jgi:hypothetical protein
MALSDTALRNAKPGDKPYKLYDERGLYLIVNPNGDKWWRLKYRLEGEERTISLGTYPEVTLAQTRGMCDDARALVAGNTDPSHHRKETKIQAKLVTFLSVLRALVLFIFLFVLARVKSNLLRISSVVKFSVLTM